MKGLVQIFRLQYYKVFDYLPQLFSCSPFHVWSISLPWFHDIQQQWANKHSYLQTSQHTGSWLCATVASSFSFKESSLAMRNLMKWMEVSAQEGRETTSDWGRFPQAGGSCMHHSVVCYGNESPGWVVRFRQAEHQSLHPKMTVNIPIVFLWSTRVRSSVFQNVTLRRNGNCMEILKFVLPTNYDACLFYCSVMIMRQ